MSDETPATAKKETSEGQLSLTEILNDKWNQAQRLDSLVTEYLVAGGLFNPEMMEHDKVRDLLFELRTFIDTDGYSEAGERSMRSRQNPPPYGSARSTENALRVKVAELCPRLFDIHQTWRGPEAGGFRTYVSWKDDEEIQEREWLAACAEFEKELNEGQLDEYLYRLEQGPRPAAFATAEQRCRAFIALHEGKEK